MRRALLAKPASGEHITAISTLLEIESAIGELGLPELAELERLVRRQLQERRKLTAVDASPSPRVLGLHEGVWTVADDFDAPLPEDFWLGTDR